MPRTEASRDDVGQIKLYAVPADPSNDTGVTLSERTALASGLQEVPLPEPRTAGGEGTPPAQQNISVWGEEDISPQ